MSVFGKSQRYLAVLQKVSDIEMRLEAVKTEVDRQNLAHQASEIPAPDEEIVDEIERRFQAVLRDNAPAIVSDVRRSLESDWDLEAVIGKEVFRLLENHLPELTAKELTEEEVAAVTDEVTARARRDVDGIVEAKLNQLIPLVEKENATTALDEFRPRVEHLTEALRRLWEEMTRIKTANRKLVKRLETLEEKSKGPEAPGGSAMIPEQLMGRASIESLVNQRVETVLQESKTSRDDRISMMEDRLTNIARTFESAPAVFGTHPKPKAKARAKAKPTPKPVKPPRRGRKRIRDAEEREAVLDGILSTKLVVRDR